MDSNFAIIFSAVFIAAEPGTRAAPISSLTRPVALPKPVWGS